MTAVNILLGSEAVTTPQPRVEAERKTAEHVWLVLCVFYLANYFVLTYFGVAFAYIARARLAGEQAPMDDGLRVAWDRKFAILQWAVFASTVGLILKAVSDRSEVGKWIAGFFGFFWNLAVYFVVPVLSIERASPGEALFRSMTLIRERWGESLVAQFSFPLLFYFLSIPGAVLLFFCGSMAMTVEMASVLAVAYWIVLSVIVFSAEQVFVTALYLYAADRKSSLAFPKYDLRRAWESLAPNTMTTSVGY